MELTREEVEKLASGDMTYNELRDKYTTISCIPIRKIAQMLLAELDQPKVWTNAPEDATEAEIYFGGPKLVSATPDVSYTRTLQKPRIDEIAEEAANEITHDKYSVQQLSKTIKSAILKDREERGN